jgi:predicted XRE-type DNA-binding protein
MKPRPTINHSPEQLAQALGLHPSEATTIHLRHQLNLKLINVITRKKLTHAQVARLASTSRTRITAIMNRNTIGISTDLILRVLHSLGYTATFKFRRTA